MKIKMKLRTKFFVILSLMIILFLVVAIFMITNFMPEYYVYKTKTALFETSEKVSEIIKKSNEDVNDEIFNIQRLKGIQVVILDKEYNFLYDARPGNGNPNGRGNGRLRDSDINIMSELLKMPQPMEQMMQNRRDILRIDELKKIFTDNKVSYIINSRIEPRTNMQIIELVTKKAGYIIMLSKATTMIKENSDIATEFFMLSGLVTLIIGFLITFFISGSLTKPIKELSEISKKMANLDFSSKYKSKSEDEIGELGNNINELSESLDKAITELKTANEKLQKEIDHERSLEKMRKEFVSSVSHELKTPISLMQGYAEGLKYGVAEDRESMEYYADVIIDESRKTGKLLSALLDLSRLESDFFKPEFEEFDLAELVTAIVNKYDKVFTDNMIEKHIEIENEIEVNADPVRIEQVVTNYINNALNHVDSRKLLDISLKKEGNEAVFKIFNTGKNIPEEDLEHIWESFYKVDKARTREYGGTGLGLSVVKAILTKHKAKYAVYNRENGVEFEFRLPTK